MYCRICGTVSEDHEIEYRVKQRATLCRCCAEDTPAKVGYDEFCKAYFEGDGDCQDAIKREFYSDYKASCYTLARYIRETTAFA